MTRWAIFKLRFALVRTYVRDRVFYGPQCNRVVLRFQRPQPGYGYKPYWAFVNKIRGGHSRLIGPVEMYPDLFDVFHLARSQARDVLRAAAAEPEPRAEGQGQI